MHDVVAVYQVEGLDHLDHKHFQLVLVLTDTGYQVFVLDLNYSEKYLVEALPI